MRWGFSSLLQDAIIYEGIPVIGLGFLSSSVLPPSTGGYTEVPSAAVQNSWFGAASEPISSLLEICQACEVTGVSVCCMDMRSSCGTIKLQRAHSNSQCQSTSSSWILAGALRALLLENSDILA